MPSFIRSFWITLLPVMLVLVGISGACPGATASSASSVPVSPASSPVAGPVWPSPEQVPLPATRDLLSQAKDYFAGGQALSAFRLVCTALASEPANPNLLSLAGHIGLQASEATHKKAREALTTLSAIKNRALTPQEQIDLARALVLTDPVKPVEARMFLNRVAKIAPEWPEFLAAQGEWELQQHQPAAALETYARLGKNAPEDLRAMWGKGYALLELNQADKALTAFQTALMAAPDDARNQARMGKATLALKQEMLATKHFQAALRIDPHQFDALIGMIPILLRHNNDMTARPFLKKALSIDPENPWVYFYQGYLFEMWGKLQKAIDQYEAAAYYGPRLVEAKLRLARVLAGIGHSFPGGTFSNENPNDRWEYQSFSDPKRALALFKEVLEIQPDHPEKAAIGTAMDALETQLNRAAMVGGE